MKKPTSAIKRLEELLELRDSQMAELQEKVDEFENLEEREWGWCRHEGFPKDKNKLPVPRLEIRARAINGNWSNFEWIYCLVYRHLLKDLIFVPFGRTGSQGSRSEPPIYHGPETEGNYINTPFRDGAHLFNDMECLNLPGFYIIETDPPLIVEMVRDATSKLYTQKKLA